MSDQEPGIRRLRRGKGFAYRDPDGKSVHTGLRRRIKGLAVPPAWTDVWICPDANGHIQATGRDAKGRKQYLYHPRFRAWREQTKFDRMLAFAEALPKLRRQIAIDLQNRQLSRTLVLATAVRVLERTLMRIGNEEYARHNQSYGLTTLQAEHIEVSGQRVQFSFRGKSGKEFTAGLSDRRVAAVLRRLEGLPGQSLFQFLDETGEPQRISSEDVNEYIRTATAEDFSAKDFRTWAATALAFVLLSEQGAADTPSGAKRNIAAVIRKVAQRLGNTPAICRASYVHPELLAAYLDGSLAGVSVAPEEEPGAGVLLANEKLVIRFLRRRVAEVQAGLPGKIPANGNSMRVIAAA